jgi:hypothetical protein
MVHLPTCQAVLDPPLAWLEGSSSMIDHSERLNAWHLELAILADAIDHVLTDIEGPPGMRATAHVLGKCQLDTVENCPFPADDDVAGYVAAFNGQGGLDDQAH